MQSAYFDKAAKSWLYLKVMVLYLIAFGMQAQALQESLEHG